MVTALVECGVQLPRSEGYLTEQLDDYAMALVTLLPKLGARQIVQHPSHLRSLFEESCYKLDATTCLAIFADTVQR